MTVNHQPPNAIPAPASEPAYRRPPATAEEAIAFIGSHYDCMFEHDDPMEVRFRLSVHDLLSAFDWWEPVELVPVEPGR